MSEDISLERHAEDQRVLIVTLQRAERRNAMSAAMVTSLLALLSDLATQEEVRAVVLAGAGRGFCAGSDRAGLAVMAPAARSSFEADSGRLARAISAHRLPVLAAVHGFAIGGGLTLAASCDIVVTTHDAKWSLPEVPIGLFPAWGLEWVTDRVGRPMARRLAWGIDTLDGEAAFAAGLADAVSDSPLETAPGLARKLAALPESQSKAVKSYFSTLRYGCEADDAANEAFAEACGSVEGAACLAGFKRK